jgi:pyrroloquinoline quinone (PQQ) biosynthesis protein C
MASRTRLQITPHSAWSQVFWDELVPMKDSVVNHPFLLQSARGELPIEQCRRGLIQFYCIVENFPKYMALNLAKTTPAQRPGHAEAKSWLIQNIYVERSHADMWREWAEGFGCSAEELDLTPPGPAIDALHGYLWRVGTHGGLAEGIGATNLAVEWPTGEWSPRLRDAARIYGERGEARVTPRSLAWLKAHAEYDDHHPYEAMELIKRCALTEDDRQAALDATKRALEYYWLALDEALGARSAPARLMQGPATRLTHIGKSNH